MLKSTHNVLSVLKNFTESISKSMRDQTKAIEQANKLKEKEEAEKIPEKDKSGAWRDVKNPTTSETYPLVKYEKKGNKLWTF